MSKIKGINFNKNLIRPLFSQGKADIYGTSEARLYVWIKFLSGRCQNVIHSYGIAKFLAYKASWILGSVRCVVGTADGNSMSQGRKHCASVARLGKVVKEAKAAWRKLGLVFQQVIISVFDIRCSVFGI